MNIDAIRARLRTERPLRSTEPRPVPTQLRWVLWEAHARAKPPSADGAWIMRRANDYFAGPGRDWAEVHEYAACLDYLERKER